MAEDGTYILDMLKFKVNRAGEKSWSAVGLLSSPSLHWWMMTLGNSTSAASIAPKLLLDLGSGDTGDIFKSKLMPTSTFCRKYIHAHMLLPPFVPMAPCLSHAPTFTRPDRTPPILPESHSMNTHEPMCF